MFIVVVALFISAQLIGCIQFDNVLRGSIAVHEDGYLVGYHDGHLNSGLCSLCMSKFDVDTSVKAPCDPSFLRNASGVRVIHSEKSFLPPTSHSLMGAMAAKSEVDVMLCQSARSLERLQELRNTWLDAANVNPSIDIQVFMPITVNSSVTSSAGLVAVGSKLNVALLEGWEGTQGSFQESMTRSIIPCMKQQMTAKFYAIMDDDVAVDPQRLVEWVRSLPSKDHVVWGRQGCCGIVYGGMLLMPQKTAAAAAQNLNTMAVHVALEVHRKGFACYRETPFNLDHFFSIVAIKLGGSVVIAPQIQELKVWQKKMGNFSWPFPAGLVAVHHMNSEHFAALITKQFAARSNVTQPPTILK